MFYLQFHFCNGPWFLPLIDWQHCSSKNSDVGLSGVWFSSHCSSNDFDVGLSGVWFSSHCSSNDFDVGLSGVWFSSHSVAFSCLQTVLGPTQLRLLLIPTRWTRYVSASVFNLNQEHSTACLKLYFMVFSYSLNNKNKRLIDWVRLNVPPTQYRSYGDRQK